MGVEIWIPFVLASAVILIIPGPTVILVITQAVAQGRRSVIPLTAGVLFGDFTAMMLSLLGLGALLAASAALFSILKWLGALYLVYLGIKLWKANPEKKAALDSVNQRSAMTLLKSAFIVTALNPKSIAFFVAFLPQFVAPTKPVLPQLTLLGGTFLFLATINAALYAFFSGHLGEYLKKRKVRKWLDRCGGCALIGAGIFTAGVQQSS